MPKRDLTTVHDLDGAIQYEHAEPVCESLVVLERAKAVKI